MKPEDVILVDAATSLEMNEEDTSERHTTPADSILSLK